VDGKRIAVLLLTGIIASAVMNASCGHACGLALIQRITFPPPPPGPLAPAPPPVPCCGGFLYQDVALTDVTQQVDLANGQVNNGHVDAFLVSGDCVRLFDGPYSGSATQPLCKVLIGPVAAGTVSPRQKIASGSYRVFEQA